MDGIHDLGGRQGFGPIGVEDDEKQFHHPWEGRVRGMVNAMSRPPDWSIDWFRSCRELIDPVDYLQRPYFDQWAQTYAAMLVNSGVATIAEVASGHSTQRAANLATPMSAAAVANSRPGAVRFDRPSNRPAQFELGAKVRAHLNGRATHTRLPAYVRGHCGTIEALHGSHRLPDDVALGGDRVEHLYTVAFNAADIWPEVAGSRDQVLLDLWEGYLEPGQ